MAAYSFPSSPVDGQRYPADSAVAGRTQYEWNATTGVWNIVPPFVKIGDQAAYNTYDWPSTNGDSGQQLTTDGSGILSWEKKGVSVLVPLELDGPTNGIRFEFTLLDEVGDPYTPVPESNILVFLGGIPQTPGVAFTISDSEISFSEAPPIGVNFYAVTSVSTEG
jgi:hypothetical protein